MRATKARCLTLLPNPNPNLIHLLRLPLPPSGPPPEDGIDVPDPSLENDPDLDIANFAFGDDVDLSEPTALNANVDQVYYLEIEVDDKDFKQWGKRLTEYDYSFLVGTAKKKGAEVRLKDLTVSEKNLFDQAKGQEISAWLDTKTVKRILRSKLSEAQIMRTRWVLTWKLMPDSTKGAKARLVVLGYEDPDIATVPNDAPTLSKDGRSAASYFLAPV